ncbi:synapse-associated protein 1-like [Protopterus annectens]|uniref:synapse-associated protein 1-like n=1 Tax=Protopterus annectens TaxID=7888 RepID=UPI001CFBF4C4|nr:synapse-associated protein 1-like [Protopterus annectens]
MFTPLSFSSWVGVTAQNREFQDVEESQLQTSAAQNGTRSKEEPEPLLQHAKVLGSYLFKVAASATKKVSTSVQETAETVKKSIGEHQIDNLIDKTILGDFRKEQEKFVNEKKSKQAETDVAAPWEGFNNEDVIKQQILTLSLDRRTFLRDPPTGVNFHFNFDHIASVAKVMLQQDECLNRMRFELVPKLVKEETFWRNYFYRVSLIKQSAELSSLALHSAAATRTGKDEHKIDTCKTDDSATPSSAITVKNSGQGLQVSSQEDVSFSPPGPEFVSDAFSTLALDAEDLQKDMEQLGMSRVTNSTNLTDDSFSDTILFKPGNLSADRQMP